MNVSAKFYVKTSSNLAESQTGAQVQYEQISNVIKSYQVDLQTAIGGKIQNVEVLYEGMWDINCLC